MGSRIKSMTKLLMSTLLICTLLTLEAHSVIHRQLVARHSSSGFSPKSEERGEAIAVDSTTGFIYITGGVMRGTLTDAAVVKYNSMLVEQWADHYLDQDDSSAWGNDITIGPDNCVYVTGWVDGKKPDIDILTIKYSPNGSILWVARFDTARTRGVGTHIAVDDCLNVFVTGYQDFSEQHKTDYDIVTLKYDPLGKNPKADFFSGEKPGEDLPTDMVLDSEGNVYVAGRVWRNDNEKFDWIIRKYDNSLMPKWTKPYKYSDYDDQPTAMAIYNSSLYVTGASQIKKDGGEEVDYDCITRRYDCVNGNTISEYPFDFKIRNSNNDWPTDIVVVSEPKLIQETPENFPPPPPKIDTVAYVYVTGHTNSPDHSEFLTLKLDLNNNPGELVWSVQKSLGQYNSAEALMADREGKIWVTGIGGNQLVTLRYETNGNAIGENQYQCTAGGTRACGVEIVQGFDKSGFDLFKGHAYVVGWSDSSRTGYDLTTIKYGVPRSIGPIEVRRGP